MGYIKEWKSEIGSIRRKTTIKDLKPPKKITLPRFEFVLPSELPKEISPPPPPRFKFVSFILPLVLIPLAIGIGKTIKKQIDKDKKVKEL